MVYVHGLKIDSSQRASSENTRTPGTWSVLQTFKDGGGQRGEPKIRMTTQDTRRQWVTFRILRRHQFGHSSKDFTKKYNLRLKTKEIGEVAQERGLLPS